MTDTTFPKFIEREGEIFKVSDVKGVLIAEIFDKESSTFKRVKSSADVLWDGKEISSNDLPAEIKECKGSKIKITTQN